jgi:PST family polysaccharide transporter
MVVLARLLRPDDFGLVAMVTTFSLLLVSFGLNGFTEAILQREDMNHALVSNLFWINLTVGVVLTAAFAGAGTLLAHVYHDPRVASVGAGVSLTILVTSLSVEHLALLKRAMMFSHLSANDIVAKLLSTVVSIGGALAGLGYWALVAGAIIQPLSVSVGAWFLCRWRPGWPQPVPGTSSVVGYAFKVYGRFTLNYFARNTDNLIVGLRFKAQSLGFYKRAYDLFALPAGQIIAPLTSVAISTLSRLRYDPEQYKKYFLKTVTIVAFVGMGLGAAMTLVGRDLIYLLLGQGWGTTGEMFTIFGPGIGVMLVYGTSGWIHLSLGKADRWFAWGVVEFAATALLLLGGARWGATGIAAAWTVSFWILITPTFWFAGAPIELRAASVGAAVWRYMLASALAAFVYFLLVTSAPTLGSAPGLLWASLRVAAHLLSFSLLYLAGVALLHGGWRPLREAANLFKRMFPWNKSTELLPVSSRSSG